MFDSKFSPADGDGRPWLAVDAHWAWARFTAAAFARPVPATAEPDLADTEPDVTGPVVVEGPVPAWLVDSASVSPVAAIDALVAIQALRARLDAAEAAFLVRAAGTTTQVREVHAERVDPETGLPPRPHDDLSPLRPC